MKWRIPLILAVIIAINTVMLTGCWNYREIEKMGIVAGMAIDKTQEGKYLLTVELVDINGGSDAKTTPKIVSIDGDTLFDAIRNAISMSGKKIYWSHAKVLVFSKDIVKEDIIKMIDWINRDAETRDDLNVLVSREKTAKEILEGKGVSGEVVSYEIEDIIKAEDSLSKAPKILMADFITAIAAKGVSPIAPAIGLDQTDEDTKIQVMGTAIFSNDQWLDFLNGEETKTLLFIIDKIKGGLLVQEEEGAEGISKVVFEIFKNKSTIKPSLKDGGLEINIHIKTTVAIDEIMGRTNYMKDENRVELKKNAEKALNARIEQLIIKVQRDYGSDIFGFGEKIRQELPKEWKRIEPTWEDQFKNLKASVDTDLDIKNSASLSKSLEFGE